MTNRVSNNTGKNRTLTLLKKDIPYYALALPGIIMLVLFAYFPMSGVVLAFKQYNYKGGIFGSPWANPWYNNFKFFFHSLHFAVRAVRNTIMFNILHFGFGSIFAIGIAIMLSEIRNRYFIKVTQSLLFLPYFLSWTVVGCIVTTGFLKYDGGLLNKARFVFGLGSFDFYASPWYWVPILVIVNIWKSMGYSSIVYYGVLTGIDPSYYEAAQIDGASKLQQIRFISLPFVKPTFVMLFLMTVGNMLKGNLSMVMGMTNLNATLLEVTDLIDVYVYRTGVQSGEMVFSSAISLFQSVFGFILVLVSNALVRHYDKNLALF